jgi:CO/xanthine dehydrogenase Mo-binding subunit
VVKNVVRAFAGGPTRLEISNVAFYHAEIRNTAERSKNFVEVCAMASRVVVDTDNCLPESEKFLKEIRADEPGDSGDDPDFGGSDEQFAKPTVR